VKTRNPILFLILVVAALPAFGIMPENAAAGEVFDLLDSRKRTAPKDVPDIEFYYEDDKTVKLSNFKGRFVLLNLWATWCPPCVEEMPSLERLQADMRHELVEVIALSEDFKGLDKVRPFYKELGIKNLLPYADMKNKAMGKLGVRSLPSTIFINKEGKEILRLSGFVNWDSKEIRDFIRDNL